MTAAALALVLLAQAVSDARGNSPFGPNTASINLIQWTANDLPRLYERSSQLPLTEDELAKLSRAGFTTPQLVQMVEQRRCACDASADGLIRMKQAGVPQEVLAAVSLHALPPNRALQLELTLDFSGQSRTAREATLYAFVDDGDFTRVLSLNLDELLSRTNQHEQLVDRSDILRTRQVRRIQLAGELPLKSYGKHTVLVATSANPTLNHPSQLSPQERAKAQTYVIDYPRSSLQRTCRLMAGWRRDAVLAYRWNFQGSRFECEWN